MEGSSSMASKPVDAFLCTICQDVLYKPVVLVCGHALCFWCAHNSMSRVKTSVCPSCRVTYSFFPEICQKLHLLLWKIDPAAQERRREETLGMEEFYRIQSAKVEDPEVEDPEVVPPQVTDATCDECRQLVFRPCVLHCGHVHCEMCIPKGDGVITCPSCQGQHPSANPNLFLDLHLYLEGEFPVEYAARRESQALLPEEHQGPAISDWGSEDNYHLAVGCDHCGMYPIRGNRYKCVECKEDVGFDLCETCYQSHESHPKPGRFNQQHNSSHTFEVRRPRAARNMLFTLLSPRVEVEEVNVEEEPEVQAPPVLPLDEESGDGDSEDEEESGDEDSDSEDEEESGDEDSEDKDEIGDEESGDEDSEDEDEIGEEESGDEDSEDEESGDEDSEDED